MNISSQLLANSKYQELMALNNKFDEAHDTAHFLRVTKYALKIGKIENADLEILEAAAMLHDIARGLEATGKTEDHLKTGTEVSEEILKAINFPPEKIKAVCYAVSVHQKREGITAETLEAKIIQDSDLLDTYGLVYVTRSILWGVQSEKYKRPLFIDKNIDDLKYEDRNLSTIHYLKYRLTDPKYDLKNLYTKTAQEIANKQIILMQNFINNFITEWRGEKI